MQQGLEREQTAQLNPPIHVHHARDMNSSSPRTWSRDEVLAALHLYGQLAFGQLHHRQPRIQEFAAWLGRTSSSVAMKLVNLASLDPQITASGRKGLQGASALDKSIWQEQQRHWDAVATAAAAAFESFARRNGVGLEVAEHLDRVDGEALEGPNAVGITREATVQVRVNQARFRRSVLFSYGQRCCMSGLGMPRLLVASHIVPWAADEKNRLNPHNGLCLSALHDRAFDTGLITVMPQTLEVKVSDRLRIEIDDEFGRQVLLQLDGRAIRMPERFRPKDEFLDWHGHQHGFW